MNQDVNWMWKFDNEIKHAVAAREKGNEGRARVCSRRAVGMIVSEYLNRMGNTNQSTNSVELITFLLSFPDLDEQSRHIASHFILKVDPDYSFPADIDLISEAQWLKNKLLVEQEY